MLDSVACKYRGLSERHRRRKWVFSQLSHWHSAFVLLSLSHTWGQIQESKVGDGKRRKAETWCATGMAQNHGMYRKLPRHSVCQCPSQHRHTLLLHPWLLPWKLFVFWHSFSEEDCVIQSLNSPFTRTSIHTHKLFKCCYCTNIAFLSSFVKEQHFVRAVWS